MSIVCFDSSLVDNSTHFWCTTRWHLEFSCCILWHIFLISVSSSCDDVIHWGKKLATKTDYSIVLSWVNHPHSADLFSIAKSCIGGAGPFWTMVCRNVSVTTSGQSAGLDKSNTVGGFSPLDNSGDLTNNSSEIFSSLLVSWCLLFQSLFESFWVSSSHILAGSSSSSLSPIGCLLLSSLKYLVNDPANCLDSRSFRSLFFL